MSIVLERPGAGGREARRLRALREAPPEIRALAEPWRSVAPDVPGLTPELEREFRFGQRVVVLDGKYRLGGAIKGGSSAMWVPASAANHDTYEGWARREGVPRVRSWIAYWRLQRLLRSRGIVLENGAAGATSPHHHKMGWIYDIARRVILALPAAHVRPPGCTVLQIGGWGPDGAKASAYEDGRVMCYDFAVKGAQRTFCGLLLHELGHAVESQRPPDEREGLRRSHVVIAQHRAFVGVEFLGSPAGRCVYQSIAAEEFLAETYMVYVSQGDRLRRHIASLSGEPRAAWDAVYARFVAWFDGIEYK